MLKRYKSYSKYGNRKIHAFNRVFDSKLEYERYIILKDLEKQGVITKLECQKTFELLPRFKRGKKTIRPITYTVDYYYLDKGIETAEDVKGFATRDFVLRKKLFLCKYHNIVFKEVYKDKIVTYETNK